MIQDNEYRGSCGGYRVDPPPTHRSSDPPKDCPCGNCRFGNLRANASNNGGGSGYAKCITIKGLDDINRTLRALGALLEDFAVSLGIEIKGDQMFSELVMRNGFSPKTPVERMQQEPTMGGSESGVSS